MPPLIRAVLWLTFLESVGTVLLQRALYFLTSNTLHFRDIDNVSLALAYGVTYVAGAFASHKTAERLGERRALVSTLFVLLVLHSLLVYHPSATLIVLASPLSGFFQGIKWPIVESFMSAGRPPAELVRELGRYNTTWGLAVPVAMVSAGLLIDLGPNVIFAAAAALNVAALLCTRYFPGRPVHLDHAHPERPPARELARFTALLVSARWCMLLSYALLFLAAPLMPRVFTRLGLELSLATSAAGLLDLARVACFAGLGAWVSWRGQHPPLVLAIIGLPIGFCMMLFANSLWLVLAGELLFGVTAGFAYTAALYYALIVKNASVDAGGAHEGLIGAGFAAGPLAGIAAHWVASYAGNDLLAMLVCVAPLMILCTLLGLRPLRILPRF